MREEIQEALFESQGDLDSYPRPIYSTRDFWDHDYTEEEWKLAESEVIAKWYEAAAILSDELSDSGRLVSRADKGFNWLPAENAYIWMADEGEVALFWVKEDKELPFEVQLYWFDPSKRHTLRRQREESDRTRDLFYSTSDEDKIAILESCDTPDEDWLTLFQYCRSYPRKAVVAAARANLHRVKRIPSYLSREQMDRMLQEALDQAEEWGDACHPASDREMMRIYEMSENELITYLDSPDEISPWLRARALLRVYDFPSDAMMAAVERNWHRPHDRRQVPKLAELIEIVLRLRAQEAEERD